jgi:hypothetical protein
MLMDLLRALMRRTESKPRELTLRQRLIALHINSATP